MQFILKHKPDFELTVDKIFVIHGIINHLLNKGRQLYCAFIDFSKAFDHVVRNNLWFKLFEKNIKCN